MNRHEKCENCSMSVLVTETFGNISKLAKEDQYYQCLAGVESECLADGTRWCVTKTIGPDGKEYIGICQEDDQVGEIISNYDTEDEANLACERYAQKTGIPDFAQYREDQENRSVPDEFKCPNCGNRDMDSLLLDDLEIAHCEMCGTVYDPSIATVLPKLWVNVYEITREYGGPEEGGWWFNWMDCIESVKASTPEEAERIQTQKEAANPGSGDIYSMRGGTEVRVWIEYRKAQSQSTERPHYE